MAAKISAKISIGCVRLASLGHPACGVGHLGVTWGRGCEKKNSRMVKAKICIPRSHWLVADLGLSTYTRTQCVYALLHVVEREVRTAAFLLSSHTTFRQP